MSANVSMLVDLRVEYDAAMKARHYLGMSNTANLTPEEDRDLSRRVAEADLRYVKARNAYNDAINGMAATPPPDQQ